MSEQLQDRIIMLESHIAEQEKTITDLSDVLADQWQAMDAMNKRLDRMQRFLENLEHSDDGQVKISGL